LAACGGKTGEVRLFDPAGEYLDRWELAVDPEAINVGADGYVYIAGEGKLLRLSGDGKVVHQADAPHVTDALTKRDEIRETIIKQQQKSVESYQRMSERYTERLLKLKEKLATLEEKEEEIPKSLTRQIASAERMVEQWEGMVERLGNQELSEEDIEKRVMASIRSSAAVASISEAEGQVFMATREPAGYGFCVWKMSPEFTGGEVIAKGLSGCCGQMDVQACKNGVYVAENSRHRVYHVSSTGQELGEWGQGAREGLEGFGSCCNPMNVAFGPEHSVYTAESGTGRIKRYSPSGELIELVGKVDVVPGCKKVSIAVDKSGDRVYMMDITRHHIVLMERLAAGEKTRYSETRAAEAKQASVSPPAMKFSYQQRLAK
jgi:sugar lactone lactonase YvrE